MSAEYEAPLAVRDQPSALAVRVPAPLVTPEEAKAAMASYYAICEAVLTPDDYQEFVQKEKVDGRWQSVAKRFKKKSAVKKLQTFWGVGVRVTEVVRDQLEDGNFGFRVTATAETKDGREVSATGGCSTYEDRFTPRRQDEESDVKYAARAKTALARSYHDVLSTAETRATNRAVMNCIGVGGGEITADEISRESREAPHMRQERSAPAPPAKKPSLELFERWEATGQVGGFNAFKAAMQGRTVAEIRDSVEMLEIAAKRASEAKPEPNREAFAGDASLPVNSSSRPWERIKPTAERIRLHTFAKLMKDEDYRELLRRNYGVETSRALAEPDVRPMADILAEYAGPETRAEVEAELRRGFDRWATKNEPEPAPPDDDGSDWDGAIGAGR